jgi:hypothetical protein
MQHLYGVQSLVNTNTSGTNIPTANTTSAELCSIATDDMSVVLVVESCIVSVNHCHPM